VRGIIRHMETKAKLENDLKDAMRSGDDTRKRTIRMVLAAIKQTEIDKQVTLDETGVIGILQKEVKTRRESLEEAQKAGRADLAASTEAEIQVLNGYLPQAMDSAELTALAEAVIAEVGATSPADMGKVMKALLPRVAGRAANDQVSQVVRGLLQK
jgi:uncharacterized protein YqeY